MKERVGRVPSVNQEMWLAGGSSYGGARLVFILKATDNTRDLSWVVNPTEQLGSGGISGNSFFDSYSLINQMLEVAIFGKEKDEFIEENQFDDETDSR